jgi:hypothetical protein
LAPAYLHESSMLTPRLNFLVRSIEDSLKNLSGCRPLFRLRCCSNDERPSAAGWWFQSRTGAACPISRAESFDRSSEPSRPEAEGKA